MIFENMKLVSTADLKICHPHFLLHVLFARSTEQVNLKKAKRPTL